MRDEFMIDSILREGVSESLMVQSLVQAGLLGNSRIKNADEIQNTLLENARNAARIKSHRWYTDTSKKLEEARKKHSKFTKPLQFFSKALEHNVFDKLSKIAED